VCEGEGDAFSTGGDDIYTVTAVVGEGRAKVVSAVPVRVPREAVVGPLKERHSWPGVKGGGRRSQRGDGEGPTRQRWRDWGATGHGA
jgi:hypothetical protein